MRQMSTSCRFEANPQSLQLMLAAYHGHAELVELLLHHGADPNRINDRGQSPLAGAVFKKEDRVVEVRLPSKLHGTQN